MKIVILGAGRVGASVAESLVSEQNDITVVDTDPARLAELQDRLDLRTVTGNAAQPSVLRNAGGISSRRWVSHAAIAVGASSNGAQITAEIQLAAWNRRASTPIVPASMGTTTRAGPMKRPTNTAMLPQRSKNRWPRATSSGRRASQGMASISRA